MLRDKHASNTGNETAHEPMHFPSVRQWDPPSTIEVNDPASTEVPQDVPIYFGGGKYFLRSIQNRKFSEINRYWCARESITAPLVCNLLFSLSCCFLLPSAHPTSFFNWGP